MNAHTLSSLASPLSLLSLSLSFSHTHIITGASVEAAEGVEGDGEEQVAGDAEYVEEEYYEEGAAEEGADDAGEEGEYHEEEAAPVIEVLVLSHDSTILE